jgi:hypothetical protein
MCRQHMFMPHVILMVNSIYWVVFVVETHVFYEVALNLDLQGCLCPRFWLDFCSPGKANANKETGKESCRFGGVQAAA